jgi:hypothetical protein
MFRHTELGVLDAALSLIVSGRHATRIVMSKARKSGNRYSESPSTRDKLSSAFVEALEKDWAEHGSEVIQQIRHDNPVKYGELIARLIPMDANLTSARDFSRCKSMEDIGRGLLAQVGVDELAMTPSMIEAAIAANDDLVARLEQIAQGN